MPRPCKYTAGICRFTHLLCKACELTLKEVAELSKEEKTFDIDPCPYFDIETDSNGKVNKIEIGIKGTF